MTHLSKGVLTQAIDNMLASEKIIQQLKGLPNNAIAIQQNVENIVTTFIPQIQQMQKQVLTLAETVSQELQKQIGQIETESDLELQRFINLIYQQLKPAQHIIQQNLQQAHVTKTSILQNSQDLQKISVELQANTAGLQLSLEAEKQDLDSLNKNKYYLLGLGVFGVPGLIALAVLISKAQNNVYSLESKIKNCQSQINQQNTFLMQVHHFEQDFGDLTDKVSKVSNTLCFIVGDINNIIEDIQHGNITDRNHIKLYFTAASQELNSLINDAS